MTLPITTRTVRLGASISALFCCALAIGCGEKSFTWAFAQNLDNSFHPNELCRQSLAESIYRRENRESVVRQGTANVFLVTGSFESYRVYGFHSQGECEMALTAMKTRQGM
jgi:hypothetical protein